MSAAILASLFLVQPAAADERALVLSGDVGGGEVALDGAQLDALPQTEFETTTLWTEGTQRFSGPSLAAVLDAADAGHGDLRLVALNDYVVDLPREAVEEAAPIVATRIDGETFGVREKGPLWVLFPFDDDPRFQSDVYYAYSVWQLSRIEVLAE